MYKVFINDSSIQLVENNRAQAGEAVPFTGIEELKRVIAELENADLIEHYTFSCSDPSEVWREIHALYTLVEAAGGVVKNVNEEILMIHRLGKWDLPKGKLESGESIEEGAKREVTEECGISHLEIVKPLPNTYHTYRHKGKHILKRTYWFEMETNFSGELVPQIEEHIEKAQWINPDFLDEYMGNTYASIHWLLKQVFEK